MTQKKYFEGLLVVAGIFLIFFVITYISFPLISELFHLDDSSRSGMLTLAVIQSLLLFIAPSFVAARIISIRPLDFLKLNKAPGWLALLGVIFAYLIALPFLNQIIYWNENISFPESISHWGAILKDMEEAANSASETMLATSSWGGLAVNLAIIALLTAFGEELFFRGTLQNAGAARGANHTAIWVVAILFSTMHFQIFGFVPRMLLGAWFGYLLYWTRSIYVPVFAHFLNNGVVVVCSWLSAGSDEFDFDYLGVVEYGFPMPAFISAVAFVIFIVYFRKFFFDAFNKKKKRIYA